MGLGEGGGAGSPAPTAREPGGRCAHTEAARTRTNAGPRGKSPRGSWQTLLPAGLRQPREWSPAAVTGNATGKPGHCARVSARSAEPGRWSCCGQVGLGAGARRGEGARPHTLTRARTVVHTHARTGGCGSPRPAGQGPRRCSPPLVTALAGWAGTRRQLPGLERRRRVPERCGS